MEKNGAAAGAMVIGGLALLGSRRSRYELRGTVSVPGVYGEFFDKFNFGPALGKGLMFRMDQTHVHKYMPKLLSEIEEGKIDPSFVISHRLKLSEAPLAYERFNKEKTHGARWSFRLIDQRSQRKQSNYENCY